MDNFRKSYDFSTSGREGDRLYRILFPGLRKRDVGHFQWPAVIIAAPIILLGLTTLPRCGKLHNALKRMAPAARVSVPNGILPPMRRWKPGLPNGWQKASRRFHGCR